jgi:hypothetical protein
MDKCETEWDLNVIISSISTFFPTLSDMLAS